MRRVGSLLHVGRSRTGPSHLAHRDRAVGHTLPHATASSAAPSRYPFSAEDITFAARWLASVDSGGAASADSAGMARQHGWDLLEGRKLPASDFWPFLFRRGKKLLLTFHGTNLQHWRQAASAARLGLGFVPHVAFLEAAQWTSAVVHAHRPESVVLSGHSMGGALAEMLSVYFTSPRHARLLGEVELGAVTFDSPSFPLQHFLQTVMVDSAAHAEDAILQYKGAPTLVNTCHPPVGGEVRRVMIPHIEDPIVREIKAFLGSDTNQTDPLARDDGDLHVVNVEGCHSDASNGPQGRRGSVPRSRRAPTASGCLRTHFGHSCVVCPGWRSGTDTRGSRGVCARRRRDRGATSSAVSGKTVTVTMSLFKLSFLLSAPFVHSLSPHFPVRLGVRTRFCVNHKSPASFRRYRQRFFCVQRNHYLLQSFILRPVLLLFLKKLEVRPPFLFHSGNDHLFAAL